MSIICERCHSCCVLCHHHNHLTLYVWCQNRKVSNCVKRNFDIFLL